MLDLHLPEPVGILAEGDMTSLAIVSKDIRYQIGEILIINDGNSTEVYLFRVMNYANILRTGPELDQIAANIIRNRESYIARVQEEKMVKVFGMLIGYSVYNVDKEKWEFMKPRSLPSHFSYVYRGSDSKTALSLLLSQEFGHDIEIGKLLVGTKTLDIPIKLDIEALPMHVQVAGTTGAGKSYFMMTFITSTLKYNLINNISRKGQKKRKLALFMVDVHDEYMRGMKYEDEQYGIQNIAEATLTAGDDIFLSLFADKFYLTKEESSVELDIRKFTKQIRFRKKDLAVNDIISVMNVSDQMSSYMYWMSNTEGEEWISKIAEGDENEKSGPFAVGTISAVKRRLYPINNSTIFTDSEFSDLAEIIYNLEKGHFYNFNSALLSSTEQFLVLTMLARTLFALRQSLMSSTTWSQFKGQVKARLPKTIAEELLGENGNKQYSLLELYTLNKEGTDYRLKRVDQLPVIMLTIEEAPSILGAQMSKQGNIFIDISRQGRKFGIGMLLITQNISSMEPTILANTNTEVNMMLGNDIEINQAIINASNNISGYEQEFKVLSRGEAIITNSLRNVPMPVKIRNVPIYIKEELDFFKSPHKKLKIKKEKHIDTEVPIL